MSLAGEPQPVAPEELYPDVQADIINGGIPKRSETFVFFSMQSPKDFCQTLRLDTTIDLFSPASIVENTRHYIRAAKGQGLPMLRVAFTNVSFSAAGLRKMQTVLPADSLGLTDAWAGYDAAFFGGMETDAEQEDASLGFKDPMEQWEDAYRGRKIDGLFIIAGSDDLSVRRLTRSVLGHFGASVTVVKTETGATRPGRYKGHEHFGFNDSISQPTLEGFKHDNPRCPDGSVGIMGEKWNTIPQSIILVQNATGLKRPKWTKHGSFLVFRKLEQDVANWRATIEADAKARGLSPFLLAAKVMGRWHSGCPIMTTSERDDPTQAFNNQFDFVSIPRKNPMDAVCPLGAHIRKMHPNRAQPHPHDGDVNQDGRMFRRGIPYGVDYDQDPTTKDRGLHFVCYQSRIEFSFRFLQMDWSNFNDFPAPGAGIDTMAGNTLSHENSKMVIHNDDEGKTKSDFEWKGLNPFITPRGGEYFFTPTLTALRETLSLGAS